MSDIWNRASAAAAARITTYSPPADAPTFTPWSSAHGLSQIRAADGETGLPAEPASAEATAYAEGFNEGRRTVEMEVAAEREAIAQLIETLEVLQPEAPEALALMLAETVERLVRQIVGEVSIDSDVLVERVTRAAALIVEEATPTRMRLNPSDLALLEGADLPVDMVADRQLPAGTVLLETSEGWIEDGSEVGLEKLRIALDRMGVPK